MKTRHLNLLMAAAITGAFTVTPSFAQTTLRLSSWAPPTHPVTTDILGGWARDVERVMAGRVKVETLATPVGAPTAYFDIVRNGIVDVSFVTHDFTPTRFVLTRMAQLPFIGDSAEAASVALWRTHDKFFLKADEHKGVKVLALMVHGPGQVFTTTKPIRSLDDFKGLKVRASAGTMTAVITALGAVPVPAPPTKSYEVLSNGVVDGTLFPPESVMGFNLIPLLKYETHARGGFYKSSFVIMMNEGKWNALSEADKKAIGEISGEAYSRRAGQVWDRSDAVARDKLKEAKIESSEAQGAFLETLQKQLAPLTDEWVKQAAERGVDGRAALAYFREQMRAAN